MRIVFLVSSMQGGGAERVAALLCNAWSECGHEVTLIPTFSGRGDCSYPLHPEVKLRFLADLVNGQKGAVRRLLALRRYLGGSAPDVVVSFLTNVNVAALLASRGLGIPVIVSERTYPPLVRPKLGRVVQSFRWLSYRWARTVVVQTQDVADWIAARCPGANTTIIANPVVLPLPETQPIKEPDRWIAPGRNLLLGAGRLVPLKRFEVLVQAFAIVASQHLDWDLAIIGDGPARYQIEKMRVQYKLEDRIHLPGLVGNPASWYRRAGIYALTSSYEGFPNTLLEAMAHGAPAVAFDIKSGPIDILKSGEAGILLPDENHVNRLAEALDHLMYDATLRQKMSDAALHVRHTYSTERVLEQWSRILLDSTSGRREARTSSKERA